MKAHGRGRGGRDSLGLVRGVTLRDTKWRSVLGEQWQLLLLGLLGEATARRCSVSFLKTERVTGRKARGSQVAGGNKLQVADVFFFFPSLHKMKRGFF